MTWSRPYPMACPVCESPYLVVQRRELRCPEKECDHTESLPENWEMVGVTPAPPVHAGGEETAPEGGT